MGGLEAPAPPEMEVVPVGMKLRKGCALLMLLLLFLTLSACRTRTSGRNEDRDSPSPQTSSSDSGNQETEERETDAGQDDSKEAGDPEEPQNAAEIGGKTRENPEASRKEYDENAAVELVPGTGRTLGSPGEGEGAGLPAEESRLRAHLLDSEAEKTALQTLAVEESDNLGVSEDAEAADSALTYYTVLLKDRMGSLFECQRQNVYWETPQDHLTVYKTSPEHRLILEAGAYDVSARLLEKNLRVDDGWIVRKNPGVIVKAVDRTVLGSGVVTDGVAREALEALMNRDGYSGVDAVRNGRVILLSEELLEAPHLQTAAMLIIAKTAGPDVLADVDLDEALRLLTEEATGAAPTGIFYWIAGQP